MNESNKRCTDLRQVDNQIYHELDQAVDEFERDKEIYNELNRPDERNNRYYYEVTTNNGESYYSELSQHNAAGDHTSCKLHQSNDQQVSFASVDKKLQLNSKIQFFLTLLLTVLFLLGISAVLIAVMFTKETPANVLLENITENMHHLVNQQSMCSKNTVNLIQQSSENSTQKLINIVSTLNNLKDTCISKAGVVDDILLVVEELLEIQNASVLFNSIRPVSCNDIKAVLPNSPTGYYHVNSRNIYCNMEELCGTGGGWTRLAYLDMSDSTVNCPNGFRLYGSNGVRVCGRPTNNSGGSCQSVKFPSNGVSYSQVCGRVVGYQYASTDGVYIIKQVNHKDINSYYVDGVSITHGYPRQHIWTLIAGLIDSSLYFRTSDGRYNCPCSQNSTQNSTLQSFIGSDYFCESGNPSTNGTWLHQLYTQDPLWDGKGCGSLEGNCCSAPGLPWFNKILNTATTDYIELRVCADQRTSDEDVPVSFYEIYIK